MREDPVPAASRVPLAERSTSWPPRASSPTPNSKLPPSGVPASLDQRREIGRPASDRTSDQTGVERDPQAALDIALSAAASRKRGSTSSEFALPLGGKRQCSVEPVGAETAVH